MLKEHELRSVAPGGQSRELITLCSLLVETSEEMDLKPDVNYKPSYLIIMVNVMLCVPQLYMCVREVSQLFS